MNNYKLIKCNSNPIVDDLFKIISVINFRMKLLRVKKFKKLDNQEIKLFQNL